MEFFRPCCDRGESLLRSLLGRSVSLSLVGKYICCDIAVVPCRSSSVCELVVLRGECKKVNKDRSQKQGIPGARTRAEAARQVFS